MQHTKDEWNVYGKVKKITKDSNTLDIRYLYDAFGNRVMKALNTGAATYPETADYYIRDASGNIMTTYRRKNSQVSSVWNTEIHAYEQPLYGSDRLGVYIPWTLTYTGKLDDLGGYTYPTANEIKHERTLNYRRMNNKRYELKDHLGNVHATLGDYRLSTVSGSGPYTYGSFSADQKSMYNYYSFGMPKYGQDQWYEANDQPASMGTTAYTYRFGFNGQEKDNEISGIGNHNTAKFWEYDTRLGRRWNLDPKPFVGFSDYSVFKNNPMFYTDVLGDSAWAIKNSWNEKYVKQFRNELQSRISALNRAGQNFTCDDLALQTVISFASKNNLPFQWSTGAENFDAASDKYSNVNDFLLAVKQKSGAPDFANDKNTQLSSLGQAQTGTLGVLTTQGKKIPNHIQVIMNVYKDNRSVVMKDYKPGIVYRAAQGNFNKLGRYAGSDDPQSMRYLGVPLQIGFYESEGDSWFNASKSEVTTDFYKSHYNVQYREFNFLNWNPPAPRERSRDY